MKVNDIITLDVAIWHPALQKFQIVSDQPVKVVTVDRHLKTYTGKWKRRTVSFWVRDDGSLSNGYC